MYDRGTLKTGLSTLTFNGTLMSVPGVNTTTLVDMHCSSAQCMPSSQSPTRLFSFRPNAQILRLENDTTIQICHRFLCDHHK
jgi:hypothetical protein